MKVEIEILKTKIKILEKINKICKGQYQEEIEKLKKEIKEIEKADKEIWEE